MTLAQALNSYFALNILIAISFLFFKILFLLMRKFEIKFSSRSKLQVCTWTSVAIFVVISLQPLMPKSQFFEPTAKIWSASSEKSFYSDYIEPTDPGFLAFAINGNSLTLQSQNVISGWKYLGVVIFFLGIAFLLKDLIMLYRIKRGSYLFKKIGKVSIFLNDNIQVPFSYLSISANVIIPSSMLENLTNFKIALFHELQHHRQKDTAWIYVLWVLKILCVANPFVHLWVREIFELQEFACDEALIGRKKVESQSYARCLVMVAQTAIDQQNSIVCATGLTLLVERNLLKRRIENMFVKQQDAKTSMKYALGIILGLVMSFTVYATSGLVRDRRVTMKEAQNFAIKAMENSKIPIVLNDLVLQELNRYLGTPEGRDFMSKALVRMETYRPLIQRKLQEYQMPEELLAVPIIESGYQNLPQSKNKTWGAGLWMFIEPTARAYGLRVDATIDERLNPELLTDAGIRYISANYMRFKDFQLAMLAYNIGESKVQEGIDKLGSRDAWYLTSHGYQGDKYLARLMAAILIMKNPESVK